MILLIVHYCRKYPPTHVSVYHIEKPSTLWKEAVGDFNYPASRKISELLSWCDLHLHVLKFLYPEQIL